MICRRWTLIIGVEPRKRYQKVDDTSQGSLKFIDEHSKCTSRQYRKSATAVDSFLKVTGSYEKLRNYMDFYEELRM